MVRKAVIQFTWIHGQLVCWGKVLRMTKRIVRRLIALSVIVLASANLFGWSAEGHETVADIAQQLLTQSGQFAPVQAILGSLTLAQISVCPDELRAFQTDGTAMDAACTSVFTTPNPPTGTSGWHFVDIPVSLTSPTHSDVVTACGSACVVTEITAWENILADTTQTKAERLQALSFVVHFIGDVHQPLHSATRGSDAGGNAENVKIDGGTTSLHHAWDANLVSDINSDPASLATNLSPEIASAQAEAQTTPEAWAIQAWGFAKNIAYAGIPTSTTTTTTLSATYISNAEPVVRQQLARAGVRLAQALATALSPAGGGTPTPTPTPAPSPTPTPAPTPSPTPAPGGTELLGNKGFEAGKANPSPWVLTSTHTPLSIINSSASEPPHTGTFDAWMNGWGTTDTDTVLQTVAIPSTSISATLSFWLHVNTAETSKTSMFDTMTVQIRDTSGNVLQTLDTFSNLNAATGYQQHSYNLNAYIGKTVQIFFKGVEDFELQTSFVLDDASLLVQ
jgi:nuclease S1